MDAKPHRPLRAFSIRDENYLASAALPGKTIHQRNKSSPALSTIASQQLGPLKPAFARTRTAFADVSNTSRVNRSSKDDTALGDTKSIQITSKEVPGADKDASAALTRPAQRPLSVSGISRFLHNITSSSSNSSTKQILHEQKPEVNQAVPLRKARSKKSTAVLRDVIEQNPLQIGSIETDATPALLNTQIKPSLPDESYNRTQQPNDGAAPTSEASQVEPHTLPPLPSSNENLDVHAECVPLNADSQATYPSALPSYSFDSKEIYVDAPSYIPEAEPLILPSEIAAPSTTTYLPAQQSYVASLDPLHELDEHIVRERYQDQYEDDGYTTARSLRSRGDYTTGPTTVVLAPRITGKVEREIAAARQLMLQSKTTDDIEEDESWDTSMVAEYGDEIFDYMHTLEERMAPNPYYMDHQTEVQWSMRSVLMDWLIQVHHRFQLMPETLFLCVNYIDRFLSCKVVSINKLQLVGATAILVAAKYEEIQCPTVSEIQYMVEGQYKVEEILKAERFMLSMLQFELGWPGPMSFLRRISKADDYDLETRTLAKYFLEVTIMDERFVASIPSFTAAGAHCLARLMLRKGSWTPAHVYYSDYTYSQLRPLLAAMLSCCDDPLKHHQAVFDKYGDKRFKRASYFVQNELDKGFVLPPVTRTSSVYSTESQYSQEWKAKVELSFV